MSFVDSGPDDWITSTAQLAPPRAAPVAAPQRVPDNLPDDWITPPAAPQARASDGLPDDWITPAAAPRSAPMRAIENFSSNVDAAFPTLGAARRGAQFLAQAAEDFRTAPPAEKAQPSKPDDGYEIGKGFVGGLVGTNPKLAGDAMQGLGLLLEDGDLVRRGAQLIGATPLGAPLMAASIAAPAAGRALQDAGQSVSQFGQEQLENYKPRVPSITSVRTDSLGNAIEDIGSYAGYQTGNVAASSAPALVAGLPAGLLSRNPRLASAMAAGGASYVQNFGDVYGSAMDDEGIKARVARGEITPRQVAGTAAFAAIPMAALDAYGFDQVVGKNLFGEAKHDLLRRMVHGMGTGALTEGATEGAQEIISQWAQDWLGSNTTAYQKLVSVVDNALGGFLGGGATAAVTSATPGRSAAPAPAPAITPQQVVQGLPQGAGQSTVTINGQTAMSGIPADAIPAADVLGAAPVAPQVDPNVTNAPANVTPEGQIPQQNQQQAPGVVTEGAPNVTNSAPAMAPDESTIGELANSARPLPSRSLDDILNDPRSAAEIRVEMEAEKNFQLTPDWQDEPAGMVNRWPQGTSIEMKFDPATGKTLVRIPPTPGTREAPVRLETPADVLTGAEQTAQPTPAQAAAGNYAMRHVKWSGLDISVETEAGQQRTGVGADGKPWTSTAPAPYGYVRGTEGRDGDHVDVTLGPNPQAPTVFIVDQIDPDNLRFDEHKAFIGFHDETAARAAYEGSFSDGSGGMRAGAVTPMSVPEFKAWLAGDTRKPLAYEAPRAARKAAQRGPLSLFEFLAQNGGIRDHGGELRSMGLDRAFVPGFGRLVRPNGRPLDMAREAATEAGYIPGEMAGGDSTTINHLLDLLGQEASGAKVFSQRDLAEVADRAAARAQKESAQDVRKAQAEVRAVAKDQGINATEAEIKHAARLATEQGMDLGDALVTVVEASYYGGYSDLVASQPQEAVHAANDATGTDQGRTGLTPTSEQPSRPEPLPAQERPPDRVQSGEAQRDRGPPGNSVATTTQPVAGTEPAKPAAAVAPSDRKLVLAQRARESLDRFHAAREKLAQSPNDEWLKANIWQIEKRMLMDELAYAREFEPERAREIRAFFDKIEGREPESTTEATPAGVQHVLPGAEKAPQAEQAQRKADQPLKPKVAQKEAGGLFSDERNQTDLVDLARKPEPGGNRGNSISPITPIAPTAPENLPRNESDITPKAPSHTGAMYAPADPLDLAMSGQLNAEKAREIAEKLKASQQEIENRIFGSKEVADEWRKLHRMSDRAWDNANDAKAKALDQQIEELEEKAGLTDQDQNYLDGKGWPEHSDPEAWKELARNLQDIENGRPDAVQVAASAIRYVPKTNDWSKMDTRERESVITILTAMNEEVRAGRDPQKFLKDVYGARFRRYGGGHDAAEVTKDQMETLAKFMKGGIQREGAPPAASTKALSKPTTKAPSAGPSDSGPKFSLHQPRMLGIPAAASEPVTTFRNDRPLKVHPDYKAAKAGGKEAAARLVQDLVKPENIAAARQRFGPDAIYAPVLAEEATGDNAIPALLATYYAQETGAQVSGDVTQVNRAFHTGAGAMERLAARAQFDGAIQRGGRYVLVDDVSVMGSTIAEMANHIRANGGEVAGVVTLVNAGRSGVLAPLNARLTAIKRRFGDAIKDLFGIEPSGLTADEADYILNFRDADALRARQATSKLERGDRLRSKGLQEEVAQPKSEDASGAPSGAVSDSGVETTGGKEEEQYSLRPLTEKQQEEPDEPMMATLAAIIKALGKPVSEAEVKAAKEARQKENAPVLVDPKAKHWDLYHGTGTRDFEKFDPDFDPRRPEGHQGPVYERAIFFSPSPEKADQHASSDSAPRIIRVRVNPGKTRVFDLHKLINDPEFIEAMRQRSREFGRPAGEVDEMLNRELERKRHHESFFDEIRSMGHEPTPWQVSYGMGMVDTAIEVARKEGLDTAIIRGMNENNRGDEVAVINPGRVFGAYSGKLLYSLGAGDLTPAAKQRRVPNWESIEPSPTLQMSPVEIERVREIVRRVAGVDPSFVGHIPLPANSDGAKAWGITKDSTAQGQYLSAKDSIIVALDYGGPRAAYHEAFHRVQDRLLNDREKQLLVAETEKLRDWLRKDIAQRNVDRMSQSEVEAEAFAAYANNRDNDKPTTGINAALLRAWGRIWQVIQRLRNVLRGLGYQTSEDIFNAAREGKMADRSPMRGPNATRPQYSFGGANAATADRAGLVDAKILIRTPKVSRVDVWKKTGWFQGVDGKWRFEIDDSAMAFKKKVGDTSENNIELDGKLSDIIKHDKLFDAYPEAKDINVVIGMGPYYSGGTGNILHGDVTVHADDAKMALDILSHELQHWVQAKEGFEEGGGPAGVEARNQVTVADIDAELKRLDEIGGGGNVRSYLEDARREITKADSRLRNGYFGPSPTLGRAYRNLAGEQEASNVMARRGMSAKERAASFPESTQEKPRSELLRRAQPIAASFHGEEKYRSIIEKGLSEAKPLAGRNEHTIVDGILSRIVEYGIEHEVGVAEDHVRMDQQRVDNYLSETDEHVQELKKIGRIGGVFTERGRYLKDRLAEIAIWLPRARDALRSTEAVRDIITKLMDAGIGHPKDTIRNVDVSEMLGEQPKPSVEELNQQIKDVEAKLSDAVNALAANIASRTKEDPARYYTVAGNVQMGSKDSIKYAQELGADQRLIDRVQDLSRQRDILKDRAYLSDLSAAHIGERPQYSLHREPRTAAERQQVMQSFLARGQPIDRALRIPFDAFGGLTRTGEWKPGQKITEKATYIISGAKFSPDSRFAFMNPVLETVRSGLIDRYNLRDLPGYVERERGRSLDERANLLKANEILRSMQKSGVGLAEARVMHAMITEGTIGPQELSRLAEPIQAAIEEWGQEAVQYGLISRESFERYRGVYMNRSYRKHELDQNGLVRMVNKIGGSFRKRIIGNQLKGRGLFEEIPLARLMRDVPDWHEGARGTPENGEKFIRLDEMSTQEEADVGGEAPPEKTLRTVYWPADRAIPDRYSGFRNQGVWEVRGSKNGKPVLWRDFTKEERTDMGEILDARYTFAKTALQAAHDLSVGKFYWDIAQNQEWARSTKPDGRVIDAAEWQRGGNAYKKQSHDWVRVPNTEITDTGGKKKYGALADKWVREEIWRDLHEIEVATNPNALASLWRAIMTQWKLNKTARSPTVHINNVMSNFFLMDLMDVRMQDLIGGIRGYATGDANYQEAFEHGAFGSDMISKEIRENTLNPILKEIAQQLTAAPAGRAGALGQMSKFTDLLWTALKKADAGMRWAYQVEDEVFRMAAYNRRRQLGDTPKQAADAAREQFIDYDIHAPWIRAARNTVLPFISYTYRAAPIIANAVATRPWKIAKYAMLAYAANAIAYALSGGDEDKERRSLREQEQGRTWLGSYRMTRMPFNDKNGHPMFLDMRNWVPAGNVFDFGDGDIPQWMFLGGPLVIGAELATNRSTFTGQEIFNSKTDDWWDRQSLRAAYAFKAAAPNAPWIPGSYAWDKISAAARGGTDRGGTPYSLPVAAINSVGLKLKPQDVQDAMASKGQEIESIERALESKARRLASQRMRNLISESYFDSEMAGVYKKMERLGAKAVETFKD